MKQPLPKANEIIARLQDLAKKLEPEQQVQVDPVIAEIGTEMGFNTIDRNGSV